VDFEVTQGRIAFVEFLGWNGMRGVLSEEDDEKGNKGHSEKDFHVESCEGVFEHYLIDCIVNLYEISKACRAVGRSDGQWPMLADITTRGNIIVVISFEDF
jgi:hypothetical protein